MELSNRSKICTVRWTVTEHTCRGKKMRKISVCVCVRELLLFNQKKSFRGNFVSAFPAYSQILKILDSDIIFVIWPLCATTVNLK